MPTLFNFKTIIRDIKRYIAIEIFKVKKKSFIQKSVLNQRAILFQKTHI